MRLREAAVAYPAGTRPTACSRTEAHLAKCTSCQALRLDSSSPAVTSPTIALSHFQELRQAKQERFAVLYVNTRNEPISTEVVAVGGLNQTSLQPRAVFGPALVNGAAGVIVAHNHPSGDPDPSPEDLAVTRHLQEAGKLLGVEVLDHLIISETRYRSMREAGLL